MQTSIKLQGMFTYSILPLIIIIFFIIILTFYFIYLKKLNKKNEEENINKISEKNIKNVSVIKSKYLGELQNVEKKYRNEKINLRIAYQSISEIIRLFVFEITDITTQNYSLSEIKKLNMPKLYDLIEEYYEPEFASKSVGDFESAINKARRVINEWN